MVVRAAPEDDAPRWPKLPTVSLRSSATEKTAGAEPLRPTGEIWPPEELCRFHE